MGSKNYHTLEGVLRKRGRSTRTIPRTSFVVMACILSVVSALRAQDQQTSVAVLARKSVDGTVVSVSVIGASLPRNHDAVRLARSAILQSLYADHLSK